MSKRSPGAGPKAKAVASKPPFPFALPLSVGRVAIDEPEEGESGTIYEYRIKDGHGDLLNVTYDADYADMVKRAVNSHAALVQALKEVLEWADHDEDHPAGWNDCECYQAKVLRAAHKTLKLAQEEI
jgi:hypothetical protein